VYEVNPLYTKQRRNAGTRDDKSDIVDAKLIAEVLTKKRALLPKITSSELSSHMLCLKKTVGFYEEQTEYGARLKNQLLQLKREQELSLDKPEKLVLSYVIKTKETELAAIRKVQRELTTQMRVLLTDHGDNLATIPGVGIIAAAKMVAHSSGSSRFANRDKFVRYAGIAPLERSSGKYQRFARGKKGNRNLHTTFYMAALNQIQWNTKAKEYYEKKLAEGKTKKQALVCVMKRTACMIYGMLRSGEAYRE
jgi:transposase